MVRHIVMWVLKENLQGQEKEDVCKRMKIELEALKDKIEYLVNIEVGRNCNPNEKFDLILNSEFKCLEDVNKYAVNEDHVKVAAFIKSVAAVRSAIDYEY